jgi:radical SAM-linked protein
VSQTEAPTPTHQIVRVRLTYARGEALRYVGNLDMQLVWERTLRRASIPMAFSKGFNPRPRMHLASALPLGFLSRCELVDLWLDQPAAEGQPDLNELAGKIQAHAAPGLELLQAELVPLNLPPLQTVVQASEFEAVPLDGLDEQALAHCVRDLLAAEALPRERRGKPYDLRPLIIDLTLRPGPTLCMRLLAREGATGRPEEVLSALGQEPTDWRVVRTALLVA